MQDNDRQSTPAVRCPNCGASNPAQAAYCSACGSRLPAVEPPDEGAVIDVSGEQPRVLDEESTGPLGGDRAQGGFTTMRIEQGRVFVSQGNRRNCLLVAVVGVLIVCCACWVLWVIPARIF